MAMGVQHPQNHGFAKVAHNHGLVGIRRKSPENAGGYGHHHHRSRHVVHPHAADECCGPTYSQQQQWRIQGISTEHQGYLCSGIKKG
ncbi:hypothetical protein ACFX1R_006425 [Malus domestica]